MMDLLLPATSPNWDYPIRDIVSGPIESLWDWCYAPDASAYSLPWDYMGGNVGALEGGAIAATREITFSIHTEYSNGAYNGSYRWDRIEAYLNFKCRYWNLRWRRTTAGRVRIIQAKTNPNSSWAAWTRGFDIRISPVYNFRVSGIPLQDYLCAKVCLHEFGHTIMSGHLPMGNLMDPNASMPTGNYTQLDCQRTADVYPKTSNPRPWLEPNAMRKAFIAGFQEVRTWSGLEGPYSELYDAAKEPQLAFGCDWKPGFWESKFMRRLPRIGEVP